jgi:oxygen-independent coproporphyrinogen-3 oxidase
MSQLKVDLDLVRKYSVPGPRYTSYPPATRFTEQIGWPELAGNILENNQSEQDLSLYFHIPFCQSLCWFCACTTVITTQHQQGAIYLDYLKKELAQMATVINPKRRVVQMHLGGGTPTFLSPDQIRTLGEMIRTHFNVAPDVEAGVEVDPRRVTRDHLAALHEVGFNRASLGVQDFDPRVQRAVHRIQPFEETERVIENIQSTGFASINIDLIYGLPYQTVASFQKTLEQVLDLAPDRLAIFSYAHVPWIKPAKKLLEGTDHLPSPETKLEILKLAVEMLTENDQYLYVGMDHFARAGDELAMAQQNKTLQRNFQGYSTRGGADIYAFGMSAISQAGGAYWQNQKELPRYYAALDTGKSPIAKGCLLRPEDRIRRHTIMRLMCDMSLDFAELSTSLGIDFQEYFAKELDSLGDLAADGLLEATDHGIAVTPTGRLFIRNIAMRFDAYLPEQTERMFSKTV